MVPTKQDQSSKANFVTPRSLSSSRHFTRQRHKALHLHDAQWWLQHTKKSRWALLIISINGGRWCTSWAFYLRAIFRHPMRSYKWNDFIWPSTSLIVWITFKPCASYTTRCYRLSRSTSSWSIRLVKKWKSSTPSAQKGSSGSKVRDAPRVGGTISYVNCAISPISVGATGCMLDAMTTIIVVVIMVNKSSTNSATTVVAMMTNTTTRRVPQSARARTSSPAVFTASMPTTHTRSTMPICATKHITNHAQTTATKSAGTTATTMTIATPVATTTWAGACILPCPANAMLAQVARAKPRRFFTKVKVRITKRRLFDVPSSFYSCKSDPNKKRHFSDVNLDWDITFEDAFVMDIEVADLKNVIQVKNLLAFDKWGSALVEPRKSTRVLKILKPHDPKLIYIIVSNCLVLQKWTVVVQLSIPVILGTHQKFWTNHPC